MQIPERNTKKVNRIKTVVENSLLITKILQLVLQAWLCSTLENSSDLAPLVSIPLWNSTILFVLLELLIILYAAF